MGVTVQEKETKESELVLIVVLLPWGFKGGLGGFGEVKAVVWTWWRSWSGTDGVIWKLNNVVFISFFFIKKILRVISVKQKSDVTLHVACLCGQLTIT